MNLLIVIIGMDGIISYVNDVKFSSGEPFNINFIRDEGGWGRSRISSVRAGVFENDEAKLY